MSEISVIVPVYNVEPYIHRCVDSILTQTFTDFELILVDDGSPDHCPAICDEYAKLDDRVHIIHQNNRGLSAARNAGIDWAFANSDSEWISFIDSDDWVDAHYLEWMYASVVEGNGHICICEYAEVENQSEFGIQDSFQYSLTDPESFWIDKHVNATIACGKLYKKQCFQNIRYPIDKIHEDEYVTYRILFSLSSLVIIEAPLYAYYQNPTGIMKTPGFSEKKLDAIEAIEGQLAYFKNNHYHRAYEFQVHDYCLRLLKFLDVIKSEKSVDLNRRQKELQMKLRKVLRQNKQYFPFETNKWVYSFAYPFLMDCYWKTQIIKGKVKH